MIRSLFVLAFAAMISFGALGCNQTDDADASGSTAAVPAATDTVVADSDEHVHAMVYCGHCGQEKDSDVCCDKEAEKCDCGMAKGAPLCCKDLPEDAKGKDLCSGCGHTVAAEEHHDCDKDCEKCDDCGMHTGAPACCKLKS